MPTESDLVELLDALGDRAPDVERTLECVAVHTDARATHRRGLAVAAAVAAVAATVVVALAVRGEGTRGEHPSAGNSAAPTVDHATYRLPMDGYYASATQRRTLQRAQFLLAQRCAQRRGVTVPDARIPDGDARPMFLAASANNIRPLTLGQARTLGYDLYPSGTDAVEDAAARLTPGEREVFFGWSAGGALPRPTDPFLLHGGCFGQAAQTLLAGAAPTAPPGVTSLNGMPGLFDDDMTVLDVYVARAASGGNSATVQRAQERWSKCMAVHGYAGLSSTSDAITHIKGLRSASAKRQAVQDVRCKQDTGFMTVWVASVTKAQNAVIAAHRAELAAFKARLATRLANAGRVLR